MRAFLASMAGCLVALAIGAGVRGYLNMRVMDREIAELTRLNRDRFGGLVWTLKAEDK